MDGNIKYDRNAQLGRPSRFAKVFRGTLAGEEVAVKRIPLDGNSLDIDDDKEVIALRALRNHENIVQLLGCENHYHPVSSFRWVMYL